MAPLIAAAIKAAVVKVVADKIGDRMTAKEAADDILAEVSADPKIINEVNAEKPWQSRVAWGSVVAALGVVVPIMAQVLGYDISGDRVVEVLSAFMTLAGAGFALYGRFKSGLKPLFSKQN